MYFLCHTGAGRRALGRAFTQDVFIVINCLAGNELSRGMFFITQAPGPGAASLPLEVMPIQPDDETFESSLSDWLATWNNI